MTSYMIRTERTSQRHCCAVDNLILYALNGWGCVEVETQYTTV